MAKNKNTGLGRGLDAIFLDNTTEESGRGVTMLRLSDIEPRPDQPRKQFESESLASLADSIAENGVLQPLLSDAIIAEMSAVGGLLIFAVGLNMQGVTKIRVGTLLPAIFVPMAYLPIQDWLQGLFH